MKKIKKTLLIFFFITIVFFIVAIIFLFTVNIIKNEKKKKDPRNWIKISVVDIISKLPPGLVIEVDNTGPRTMGASHFRLIFKINELTLCRVDTDLGNFKSGERKRIVLRCSDCNPRIGAHSYPLYVNYILQVFPEMKKPLMIEGSFYAR